jgi:uncharacterized DUF497 family protein
MSMFFDWDDEKNERLKAVRGVSFEMVEEALLEGKLLKITEHPNVTKYPNQEMMYIEIMGYIHCVPFVKVGEVTFLKTIYPSRKANRVREENNEEIYEAGI